MVEFELKFHQTLCLMLGHTFFRYYLLIVLISYHTMQTNLTSANFSSYFNIFILAHIWNSMCSLL